MKKISLHNAITRLIKNRAYLLVNIGGIVTGIAVSLFLGVMIRDETIANNAYKKHEVIVTGIQCKTPNGNERVENFITVPALEELRVSFGSSFQFVILASEDNNPMLKTGDKKIRYKVINPSLSRN